MRTLNVFWGLVLASPLVWACSDNAAAPADGGTDVGTDAPVAIDPCAGADSLRAGNDCDTLFPDRIDASTTIARGCYRAKKNPIVAAGATLTIAPGTVVLFAEGTGLDVGEDRALILAGTAAAPICLTGEKAQRGAWDGLTLGRTDAADDKLDWVTVEYAGSTKSDAEAAAIMIRSDSRPPRLSMTNVTVRQSQGYGLYLVGSTELTAFAGNTFTKNGNAAASVDSNVVGFLDATSRYSGNDVDEVRVRPAHTTKNLTWHPIGVPFHVMGNLNIDGPWVLEAPSTVVVAPDRWISINDDAAGLHAVGTADKPIVFTGETKTRGAWDALRFVGTNNASNRLEFVTVEYGGTTAHDFNGACVNASADSSGVTLGLTNVTIRECQGFGLFLAGSAVLPTFTTNTFTKNGLGPASVGSEAVEQLDTTSTYTGNDVDRVRVRDGSVSKAVTWQDLGVPYQLEQNVNVDLVWTLAPGVTLLLTKDKWISVSGDAAALHAVGTAQKPITISGVEKTPGYWHALRYDGSLNAANALEYATVEYGGSTGGGGEQGMIHANADSHGVVLSVKSSTVRNSGQYGIWLGHYAQYNSDIESSNTFSGNASGNVFKAP